MEGVWWVEGVPYCHDVGTGTKLGLMFCEM